MLSVPGALLAVVLFAIHPVNVESVAWIFQQRGLLAFCFSLCSIFAFLRSSHSWGWYCLTIAPFAVAMLSKGSAAIVPLVLLGILWHQRRTLSGAHLLRTLPFFAIAAVLTLVNIWFQAHSAGGAIRDVTFAERLAGAGVVVWFYLAKAVLPINLLFIYPQIYINAAQLSYWLPLAAIAIVFIVLWRNRLCPWARRAWLAWAYFCVARLPVAGLVDAYFMKFSLVADHYAQFALIGVVVLAGCIWHYARQRATFARWLADVIALAIIGAFCVLTFNQTKLYADAPTLYRATLEKNPTCWLADYNLGVLLAQDGQFQQSIHYYQAALEGVPAMPPHLIT